MAWRWQASPAHSTFFASESSLRCARWKNLKALFCGAAGPNPPWNTPKPLDDPSSYTGVTADGSGVLRIPIDLTTHNACS